MDQKVNLNGTCVRRNEYHSPRNAEITHMVPKDHSTKATTTHITLIISPVPGAHSHPSASVFARIKGSIDLNTDPIRRMA